MQLQKCLAATASSIRSGLGGALRAGLVGALALGPVSVAKAENGESFFYSDQAALRAGAMAGVSGDTGSVWYNPAGLGGLHHNRVTANGSVFGVRVRPIEDALQVDYGSTKSSLDIGGTDVISTPTAVLAVFALSPKITLGGGVITTERDVRASVGRSQSLRGEFGEKSKQRLSLLEDSKQLHIGGAYGIEAGYGLRVGGGMFVSYSTLDTSADYGVSFAVGQDEELIAISQRESQAVWGLKPTAGLQWDAADNVHLGLMVRLPTLLLTSSVKSNGALILSSPEGTEFEIVEDRTSTDTTSWVDPARIILGVEVEPTPGLRLSADCDLSIGIDNELLGTPRRAVVNFRAGAVVRPIDSIELGAGVFYDAPDQSLADAFGATRLTYFGGTLGGTWRTPLRVTSGKDGDSPLVLTTTLAVRYAAGFGEARQILIGDVGTGNKSADVVTHDVMPYTGSAILF